MTKQTRKVTREEIYAAADEIAQQGETPTLEAIRQRVGGSFTTLSPALREWRERRKRLEQAASRSSAELPPALAARLQDFGSGLWSAAAELADKQIQAEREQLATDRQQAEAAQAEVAETADRLARQVENLQDHSADLEEQIRTLRTDLAAARETATQAQSQAAADRRIADELRSQLAATRQSLCADLVERVDALERALAVSDGGP